LLPDFATDETLQLWSAALRDAGRATRYRRRGSQVVNLEEEMDLGQGHIEGSGNSFPSFTAAVHAQGLAALAQIDAGARALRQQCRALIGLPEFRSKLFQVASQMLDGRDESCPLALDPRLAAPQLRLYGQEKVRARCQTGRQDGVREERVQNPFQVHQFRRSSRTFVASALSSDRSRMDSEFLPVRKRSR